MHVEVCETCPSDAGSIPAVSTIQNEAATGKPVRGFFHFEPAFWLKKF